MRPCFLFLLVLLGLPSLGAMNDTWDNVVATKKGSVTFYWYPNNITVSESKDIIDGVEHDLAFAFIDYLNKKYELDIQVQWVRTSSFNEVMTVVEEGSSGVFGTSSISITEERKRKLNFTPPYLTDVAVLISNAKIPIAQSEEEFLRIFEGLTAVTIINTTLNQALLDLNDKEGLNLQMEYVENSGNIIDKIEALESAFGYIDLPNFLVAFDKSTSIRRQFFHPIKLEGLAMIYPLKSDWNVPVADYFSSHQFELDKARIIVKYLGEDVTNIIDMIARSAEIGPYEEIVISNKEKELQYEELLAAAVREKEKSRINGLLMLVAVVAVLILLLLYISNRIKARANKLLLEQQQTIETRNHQLQKLNEEKNDIIKIIAHDLRSPLATISGVSMLQKQNKGFSEEDHKLNDYIRQSSDKMEAMIAKILDSDAIDSGRRNMKIESVNVSSLVESVILENKARADEKEIELVVELEKTALAMVDRFYTAQIVENLLSNAIKFSHASRKVFVKTEVSEEHVRLIVKDQGPGLTETDEKQLFKKYQRLSAAPTAGESSVGLGLSIVQLYTEMMRGEVSFETKLGAGTSFFVDLPLVE